MAEEPKIPRDRSSAEVPAAEKPKAKKRAHSAPPVPEEALKPRKRAAKKAAEAPVINRIKPFKPDANQIASAEFMMAKHAEDMSDEVEVDTEGSDDVKEALADIRKLSSTRTDEVSEALDDVRKLSEESAWDAKIAKAKADLEQGEEVADEDIISVEKAEDDEPYAEMSVTEGSEEKEMSEDERALAAYREAHPVLTDVEGYRKLGLKQQAEEAASKGYEARLKRERKEASAKEDVNAEGFNDTEAKWFKKGEEDEARQMAEARATIERGGKGELMVENPDDYSANIKEAATLVAKGELDKRDFSLEDYEYLLKERIRVDKELEHAGWWQARKLRKALKEIQKGGYDGASGSQGLDDYEKQIMDAKVGAGAMRRDEKERAAKKSAKKLSFWERLRMDKGR